METNVRQRRGLRAWQIVFLLALVAGSVWIVRRNAGLPMRENAGSIFGTTYHVKYEYGRDLGAEMLAELQRVDASLSIFNKESTISRLNRNETDTVDARFAEVFGKAQAISRATGGAFDMTVAPLVNAWGFGFSNAATMTQECVDSLLPLVGYGKVRVENGRLRKAQDGMTVDAGAIAKGYGVDRVARLLDSLGVRNYMVEIGGEIVARGRNKRGENWHIGVSRPVEGAGEGDLQTVLSVNDVALATSGNYRNFYYKDGKRYAHTIDPHTGWPVQHALLSASVFAPDCTTADAYATAFMVLGLEGAKKVLAEHPELMAYLVYADGEAFRVWHSPGLKKWIVN